MDESPTMFKKTSPFALPVCFEDFYAAVFLHKWKLSTFPTLFRNRLGYQTSNKLNSTSGLILYVISLLLRVSLQILSFVMCNVIFFSFLPISFIFVTFCIPDGAGHFNR